MISLLESDVALLENGRLGVTKSFVAVITSMLDRRKARNIFFKC